MRNVRNVTECQGANTYIPLSPPARHNLSHVESQDEVEWYHGAILVTVSADLLQISRGKTALQTAGLAYIEYFSLARVEDVAVDHAEDRVECQPDQIP